MKEDNRIGLYSTTPEFSDTDCSQVEIEKMRERFNDKLRKEKIKRLNENKLKGLNSIPSSEIKKQKKSMMKSTTAEKTLRRSLSSSKLFDKKKRRSKFSKKMEGNASTGNLHNFSVFKKENFSILIGILLKEKNISKFCNFAEKHLHLSKKISTNTKNIQYLFHLWQDLNHFSNILNTDLKTLLAFEIYSHYFKQSETFKDVEPIFSSVLLEELKKNILYSQKNRVYLYLENFYYLKSELEKEISFVVLQYAKEQKIKFKKQEDTSTFPKNLGCFDLIKQIYLDDHFLSNYLDSFFLYHSKWITSESLLQSLFTIFKSSNDSPEANCIKSS